MASGAEGPVASADPVAVSSRGSDSSGVAVFSPVTQNPASPAS